MASPSQQDIDGLMAIFAQADTDGDGTISREEMRALFQRISPMQTEQIDLMFNNFDVDGDNKLGYKEFINWLTSERQQEEASGAAAAATTAVMDTFAEAFKEEREQEEKRVEDRIHSALEDEITTRHKEGKDLNDEQQAKLLEDIRHRDAKSHPAWEMEDAYAETLTKIVIDELRSSLAPNCPKFLDVAFVRALARVPPSEIAAALRRRNTLDKIAAELHRVALEVNSTEAVTGSELNDKFATSDDRGFSMVFGDKIDFFGGLEERIGSPEPRLLEGIVRDHCSHCDSRRNWTTGNYGIVTSSWQEFLLVAQEVIHQCLAESNDFPDAWRRLAKVMDAGKAPLPPKADWPQEWPKETKNCEFGRKPQEQRFLIELVKKNVELLSLGEKVLRLEEGMLLRLYTGPMFEKYNLVPRGGALGGCPDNKFMEMRFQAMCCGENGEANRYTTSIHVLNSAVIKLSKLTKVETVYRGLGGNVLPVQFWNEDKFGCKGGVEFGFMSTTLNRAVAMQYAGSGSVRMVLELETGGVDRGADLAALSQYPHEKEILFPPLASLEVRKTQAAGGVLLVKTRVNINLLSPTIDEVVAKRYKMLLKMAETNKIEIKQFLTFPTWQDLAVDRPGVIDAVQNVADSKMDLVLSAQATHYNHDSAFLASIEQLVSIAADIRSQKSTVMRAAGSLLEDERLLALADEREESEVMKKTVEVKFETCERGVGSGWFFSVLGFERGNDGGYYASGATEYRGDSLEMQPVAVEEGQIPKGWALINANGRRDLEQWAKEKQESWVEGETLSIKLQLSKPIQSKEFKELIERRVSDGCSPRVLAMFLMCNATQKDIDAHACSGGNILIEALRYTMGTLTAELFILSASDLTSNDARALGLAINDGMLMHLKHLELFNNSSLGEEAAAYGELIASLGQCPHLEFLSLGDTGMTDEVVSALCRCTVNDGDDGMSGPGQHQQQRSHLLVPRLRYLHIGENNLGPNSIQTLASTFATDETNQEAGPPVLRALWLQDNPKMFEDGASGDALVRVLGNLPGLEECSVYGNSIPDQLGAQMAPKLAPTLLYLDLANNAFGSETAKAFANTMPQLTALRSLFLNGNESFLADDATAIPFVKSLGSCKVLQELNLADAGMSDATGEALAQADAGRLLGRRLKLLDVSSENSEGHLGGRFASSLAVAFEKSTEHEQKSGRPQSALRKSPTTEPSSALVTLWMGSNKYLCSDDPTATVALMKSIGKLKALEYLGLGHTGLTDAGGAALAEAGEGRVVGQQLKTLYLHGNGGSTRPAEDEEDDDEGEGEDDEEEEGEEGDEEEAGDEEETAEDQPSAQSGLRAGAARALAKALRSGGDEKSPALETLWLDGNPLLCFQDPKAGQQLMQAITRCENLTEIGLSNTGLSDKAAAALAKGESGQRLFTTVMHRVDLGDNRKSHCLKALAAAGLEAKSPGDWAPPGGAMAMAFGQALIAAANKAAESDSDVEDDEDEKDGADKIPAIKRLRLSNTGVLGQKSSLKGADLFMTGLSRCPKLKILRLDHTGLRDSSGKILAKALSSSKKPLKDCLRELDLQGNALGADFANALAKALPDLDLKRLRLQNNENLKESHRNAIREAASELEMEVLLLNEDDEEPDDLEDLSDGSDDDDDEEDDEY